MKITKKERKKQRQLVIQKNRVIKIEDYMIENVKPVICDSEFWFTDNEEKELNTACKSFFVPAGTVVTGVIYKIEVFWVMVQGRMRIIEGDHERDIQAPQLLMNRPGVKNGGYAYEDCLFYGFTPNPTNTRDLKEVINTFSATPAEEVQGFEGNKQMNNYIKRLENESYKELA